MSHPIFQYPSTQSTPVSGLLSFHRRFCFRSPLSANFVKDSFLIMTSYLLTHFIDFIFHIFLQNKIFISFVSSKKRHMKIRFKVNFKSHSCDMRCPIKETYHVTLSKILFIQTIEMTFINNASCR